MIASNPWLQSDLNLFMDAISICLFCSKVFDLFHNSKEFITYCHVVIFPCIPFMRQKHILSFLNIYSYTNPPSGDYQSFCAFLYCMDASTLYINITINQKVMHTI